jgi:hypothetical protein
MKIYLTSKAVVLMGLGLGWAGCALPPETGGNVEPSAPIVSEVSPGTELTTEPVGEASQGVTRADCIASWQHNLRLCDSSPPNLRPECWAACAALLAGCLAVAQG